jgi:hypothetical protein
MNTQKYTQEEIDDYEEGLREREFNSEFDYIDTQIGKTPKIKQSARDKTLTNAKPNIELEAKKKYEQYLREQNRIKQLKKNAEKQQLEQEMEQQAILKKPMKKKKEENEKEIESWEDLY